MSTVAFNLYTNGNELITNEGRSYIGYYHINSSGSIFSESDFVSGVSQPLRLYTAMPENGMGDVVSEYDEENDDYDGIYTIIPVKNYKNDIDLPEETILLEDPGPITITDQPDLFFKRSTDDVENPGLEVFIDESNIIRVRKGTTITLQFGYESSDSPDNIEFQWFDSFDRIVSTDPILVLDTNELDAEEDIFYCTVTDSFGSDTTNEITINIIDPADNPFMFNNILANGNANDGTANWDSVGDAPEDTGKFLPVHEQDEIPDIVFGLQAGSRFYHKFNAGQDGLANKNQWYPRPSDFDRLNKFNGTVVSEIKDNYFRAGNFLPVVRGKESNHSGTTKNSIQIVDLTDIGDLIDGKVFGLEGFDVTLFGWLGGRADQADRVFCEFEFLNDENEVILTTSNTRIEDADWYQRTINEYREPNQPPKISYLHAGYKEPTKVPSETPLLKYDGIYKDGNIGIDFNRYEIITEQADGSIRTITPVVKTAILGRTTDMVRVPVGTRSIRVIKTYYHVPGVVDLIWGGDAWAEAGNEYVSDALVAGLNLRMYPILKNTDTGDSVRTGLDNSGNSVIKFMDFLEEEAAQADIEDLDLITDGTESGTQYYDNQELKFDPVAPATILGTSNANSMFTFSELTSVSNYFSSVPYTSNKQVEQLGSGWSARTNDALREYIETNFPTESDPDYSLRKKLGPATPGIGGVGRELPYTENVNTLLTQETFTNNEVRIRPPGDAGALTVEGYRNILSGIEFWKYNLIAQFRDLEFKFRNTGLGNNGASKLTISGIVPKIPARTITIPITNTVITLDEVPSREYVIYTELRGINLERWNVRVPYLLGLDGYNFLDDVPGVPAGYRIEAGLGYRIPGPNSTPEVSSNGFSVTKAISLFDSARSIGLNLILEFPDTPVLTRINTSEILSTQIPSLYSTYQEHPLVIFSNTNTNSNPNNKKFYNLLPVGITRYKVKLELANGEKVSRFFDTNWFPVTI